MASFALQGIAATAAEERLNASLEKYKRETRKDARSNLLWGAAFVLLHVALLASRTITFGQLFRSFLFIIGLVGFGIGIWQVYQARGLTVEDLEKHNEAKAFAQSVAKTRLTYTKALLACLILVGVIQLIGGYKETVEAAGLVKPAVWNGEMWRLLTGATLHASFMHIWMNSLALIGLGRQVEAVSNRAYLTIVFLVSAVSGSIFSLLLMPNATSVGASGGLMGLVGFLAVLGLRRKENLPSGFFKSIVINICFIGAIGLVGFAIIDNAAHLGGLLGGAGCGAVLIKGGSATDPSVTSKPAKWAGVAALVVIAVISLLSVAKMVK